MISCSSWDVVKQSRFGGVEVCYESCWRIYRAGKTIPGRRMTLIRTTPDVEARWVTMAETFLGAKLVASPSRRGRRRLRHDT